VTMKQWFSASPRRAMIMATVAVSPVRVGRADGHHEPQIVVGLVVGFDQSVDGIGIDREGVRLDVGDLYGLRSW
jgi:hypothetical protein